MNNVYSSTEKQRKYIKDIMIKKYNIDLEQFNHVRLVNESETDYVNKTFRLTSSKCIDGNQLDKRTASGIIDTLLSSDTKLIGNRLAVSDESKTYIELL